MSEPGEAGERVLVERSRRGDRAAFEELVRLTGRGVFAKLYLDTADPHRAEDLTQETFLLAWRSIGGLSDAARFRGWLAQVAHSVLVDDVRRRGRGKRGGAALRRGGGGGGGGGDEPLMTLAAPGAGPEESAEAAEQRRRALAVLRALPEEYRVPLTLRYLGGADYDAIAKELALTNGSLRGLLSRGLAMLRARMEERLNHEDAKTRSRR